MQQQQQPITTNENEYSPQAILEAIKRKLGASPDEMETEALMWCNNCGATYFSDGDDECARCGSDNYHCVLFTETQRSQLTRLFNKKEPAIRNMLPEKHWLMLPPKKKKRQRTPEEQAERKARKKKKRKLKR